MNKKQIFIGFLTIITIFISYYMLHPMAHTPALKQGEYLFKPLNVDNKFSAFLDKSNGVFTIYPHYKSATGAAFKFNKRVTVNLNFSALNTSSSGNVKFLILKNGMKVQEFDVRPKEITKRNILLSLNKIDTLKIWVKKEGDKKTDWQNLTITVKEPHFKLKNFIIPFLWSLFFIFLLAKGHQYIAFNAYIGFLLILFAEKKNFGFLTYEDMLTYMLFLFGIAFLFTLLYQGLRRVKKYKIATLLAILFTMAVYTIPLSLIIFTLNYHIPFTKDALFAIFQSNMDESLAYISDYIQIKYILLFIFITTFIGFILYKQEKKETKQIETSLLIFLIIVFLGVSSVHFLNLRLPDFLLKGFNKYTYEIAIFKKMLAKRKIGDLKLNAIKKGKGETYIVVIGESLNKNHMGVYGYLRETTPMLSSLSQNNNLVLFHNIYSNHTHTQYVLSLALTEANQYNKKNFYRSPSIIDILKTAKVETYWLSNQPLYSIYDNMVSIIGTSADHVVGLNTAIGGTTTSEPKYDGALIDRVKKILQNDDDKNRVIFVHLGGSHDTYTDRYPKKTFTKFFKPPSIEEFGEKASKVPTLNSYDNSVYYNDYVVGSIFKIFKNHKNAYAFVYMPDHAEDVINQRGHNSSIFTYTMTQIPLLAWFSNQYKQKYPNRYQNLLKHTNTLFSNDMLYDSLVGIVNIETNHYNPKYDLSSAKYELKPENALTLHGQKKYTDPSNYIYWQKSNIDFIKDNNLSSKIVPTAINTGAKLHKIIFNKAFKSVELSLALFQKHDTALFKVTNNSGKSGISFEDYLHRVEHSDIEHIFINIHNVNEQNYQAVLARFSVLGRKSILKKKIIIQSDNIKLLHSLKKDNWNVSYKLPHKTIVNLIKKNNTQKMDKLSQELTNTLKQFGIKTLSFDQNVYDWVKKYLGSKIDHNTEYYVYLSNTFNLYNNTFRHKIQNCKFFSDPKVKIVFSSYKSVFDL